MVSKLYLNFFSKRGGGKDKAHMTPRLYFSKFLPETSRDDFTLTSLWTTVGLTIRNPVPGRKPNFCRSLLIFAKEVDICSQIEKKWSVNYCWPRDGTAAQMYELH